MSSLLIRNVDEALHAQLKARAAAQKRSMEEEARELLRFAMARQDAPAHENLADLAQRLFGPEGGIELELPPRRNGSAPPDFSGREFDR